MNLMKVCCLAPVQYDVLDHRSVLYNFNTRQPVVKDAQASKTAAQKLLHIIRLKGDFLYSDVSILCFYPP
jgi:hypothetical protein